MKQSSLIPDELLSAYIDRQINEAELRRVEQALNAEPDLRYRLEALQTTVALLQNAPTLVVPRAFALSENQALAAGGRVRGVKKPGFWEQWLPRLAPAMTAVIAILFVFSLAVFSPMSMERSVKPAPSKSAVAAESPSLSTVEVQSMAVEQPASVPRTALPRSVEVEKEVVATLEVAAIQEAAPEPLTGASAENTEKATDKTSQPTAAITQKTTEPTASPAARISWITWLLGLLLILFIFLTWRVTFARPRR